MAVGGFGAEVAASVAEHGAAFLRAPVRRLGAPRTNIAYAPPAEDAVRVGAPAIAQAVREMMRNGDARR